MSSTQAITRVWSTTRGLHSIIFTWVTGLTPVMVLSTVIRLAWVTRHGITRMVTMVIIRQGTTRTITVLTGGPTAEIVHIPATVAGAIMVTAMPSITRDITVTGAVKMGEAKGILPVRMVISTATTAR